jgi:hypothetical protein
MTKRRRLAFVALAALFVVAFALQCVAFVRANSQTYDEGATLVSGSLLLRGGPDVNAEHPPLARVLAALPIEARRPPRIDLAAWQARRDSVFGLGRDYLYEGGVPFRELLQLGRAPMVAIAVALIVLVGLFAHRLWGPRAGLLAVFLAAFDPNLVAHGSLASHDGVLAFFLVLVALGLTELFARPSTRWLVGIGFASGLCLLTKFSGVVALVLVAGALMLQALTTGGIGVLWLDGTEPPRRGLRALLFAAGNAVLPIVVAVLLVKLVYRGGVGGWLDGLRAQVAHQEAGHRAFFFGEIRGSGWTSYYPVALLLKCPPLTLLLAVASLAWSRRGKRFGAAALTVLLPIALVLGGLLVSRVDIGVRYMLPIFPLLAVAASRIATIELPRGATRHAIAAVVSFGLLHHVYAAVRIAPYDLAFFSDLAGGPARGHRYLSDSNIDWGQDLGALARWSEQTRPERLLLAYFGTASIDAYGIAYQPAPNGCPHPAPWRPLPFAPNGEGDYLAVSTMNLQGVFMSDPKTYGFLEQRRPVTELGYGIRVYNITKDAEAHRLLAALYERQGLLEFSAVEAARARAVDDGSRP